MQIISIFKSYDVEPIGHVAQLVMRCAKGRAYNRTSQARENVWPKLGFLVL